MAVLRQLAIFALGAGLVALVLATSPTLAQTSPIDPPDRVARLSEVSGQAWVFDPDREEWIEALRNRPLTSGNRLATEADAYAEVQLGATTLRLDADTEVEVVTLDDEHFSLELHGGSIEAQVRDPADATSFELTTTSGRFVLQAAGRYRFDQQGGHSSVTVLEGQALYQGLGTALAVEAGQRGTFWIDAAGVAQYTLGAPIDDTFARANRERERSDAPWPPPRYVSPEMTGARDLERYGSWEHTTEYGVVWTPYVVPSGWAPYSAGHWTWMSPWGWTWVDDAPWGYAPFHYGRWVHLRNRWCWTPGARVARPVYAPALVAWVGGPRFDVSISTRGRHGPAVGWFALAPHEVYVPSYRVSPRYVRDINITHVTQVTNITRVVERPDAPRHFANRSLPHAVTIVPAGVMTGREAVAPAAARWRATPQGRELASRPHRDEALLRPPVAAPQRPAQPAGLRAIAPPSGIPEAVTRRRAVAPPTGARTLDSAGDSVADPGPSMQPPAPHRMRRPAAPPREDRKRMAPAGMGQPPVDARHLQPHQMAPMRRDNERARPIAPGAARAQAPNPHVQRSHAPPMERRAEPPRRGSNRGN